MGQINETEAEEYIQGIVRRCRGVSTADHQLQSEIDAIENALDNPRLRLPSDRRAWLQQKRGLIIEARTVLAKTPTLLSV